MRYRDRGYDLQVNLTDDLLGPTPVKSLSIVVILTFTFMPALPGGAMACTRVVCPQSRSALPLLNFLAATLPKKTPATQPRFAPLIEIAVPPFAGPAAGLARERGPQRCAPGGVQGQCRLLKGWCV
jgi:hypothetical protein